MQIISLQNDFSQEENFDLRSIVNRITKNTTALLPDQVEVLSQLHRGQSLSGFAASRSIKQFHPQPFIFSLEYQLGAVEDLRKRSQERLLSAEVHISRYEVEHEQRLMQLNRTVDHVLDSFRKLDKRVRRIAHTSMFAGQTIESMSLAQGQAHFARFFIRIFLQLNLGDISHLDPILTTNDDNQLLESAQLIQLLQSTCDELLAKTSTGGAIDQDTDDTTTGEDTTGDGDDTGTQNRLLGDDFDSPHSSTAASLSSVIAQLPFSNPNMSADSSSDMYFGTFMNPSVSSPGVNSTTKTTLANGDHQVVTQTRNLDGTLTVTSHVARHNPSSAFNGSITDPSSPGDPTKTLSSDPTKVGPVKANGEVTFTTAAHTIRALSRRIEGILIDKFRLCLLRQDFSEAFRISSVLYNFKDSRLTSTTTSSSRAVSDSSDANSHENIIGGHKFASYARDAITWMRIPHRVDRRDLVNSRAFTSFFTNIVLNIVGVLRKQCQLLPRIFPNAIQIFEDLSLTVFQSYLPRLIVVVIDHPSLQSNPLKSLRLRATMLDISRRAACEVIFMMDDLAQVVQRRNISRRRRELLSTDSFQNQSVLSRQLAFFRERQTGVNDSAMAGSYTDGTMFGPASMSSAIGTNAAISAELAGTASSIASRPLQKVPDPLFVYGFLTSSVLNVYDFGPNGAKRSSKDNDDFESTTTSSLSRATGVTRIGAPKATPNYDDEPSISRTTIASKRSSTKPNKRGSALPKVSEDGEDDDATSVRFSTTQSGGKSSTGLPKSSSILKNKNDPVNVSTSLVNSNSPSNNDDDDEDDEDIDLHQFEDVAAILARLPPKSSADIDACFTSELSSVSSLLRDHITTSLDSFCTDWFEREHDFLLNCLKQVHEEMLFSKQQSETSIQQKITSGQTILGFSLESHDVEIEQTRRIWIQDTITDPTPIDFILRTVTGSIRRALLVLSPEKRPDLIDQFFTAAASFIYSSYLSPLFSESVIRFSPWGQQLLKMNQEVLIAQPSMIPRDIINVYMLSPQEIAAQSASSSTSSSSSLHNVRQVVSFVDLNQQQQQLLLHRILPNLGPQQLQHIQTSLQSATITVQTNFASNLTKQSFRQGVTAGSASVRSTIADIGSTASQVVQSKSRKNKPSASTTNSSTSSAAQSPNALDDFLSDSVIIDLPTQQRKIQQFNSTKTSTIPSFTSPISSTSPSSPAVPPRPAPEHVVASSASMPELTQENILFDLFFILTIVKSAVDIDKRVSTFFNRVTLPHITPNTNLHSLAQSRFDQCRGSLEARLKQFLQCYCIYVSFCFDHILKQISTSGYKIKAVDKIHSTTDTTTLWMQSARLIDGTCSALITTLSGLNIDDSLSFLGNQIYSRFILRLARGQFTISQLGAPLFLQDLSYIVQTMQEMGIPSITTQFSDLHTLSYIFFVPFDGIRAFLTDQVGSIAVDMDLVILLVRCRADYATYKHQIMAQIHTFAATIGVTAATPDFALASSAGNQSGQSNNAQR